MGAKSPKSAEFAVSVVVPAYNADRTLREALDSIYGQTHRGWEAIVVDDGSSDATAAIAREYEQVDPRFKLIQRANGGESAARNTGVQAANHPWLLFLDSDDWIAPTYLERASEALARNPTLDAVHCRWVRIAVDGTEIRDSYEAPEGDMFLTWARRSAFPVHACVVRRLIVEEIGKFDESLHKSSDWDLWQRVARSGARFGVVDEVLAYYRAQPGSSSMDAAGLLEDGLRVLARGHKPDARVKYPVPEHSAGAPSEGWDSQIYYLVAWCAGLAIGGGYDARALLKQVGKHAVPDLDPEGIARSIFESATLPVGRAADHWEDLWPSVRPRAEEFLKALEERSQTIGLADLALADLRVKMLQSSPTFGPLVARMSRLEAEAEIQAEDSRLRAQRSDDEVEVLRLRLDQSELRLAEMFRDREALESRLAESEALVSALRAQGETLETRLAESAALVSALRAQGETLEARLYEKHRSRLRLALQLLVSHAKNRLERPFFYWQLRRLRLERFLSLLPSRRGGRVMAIASWSFPIYSQTFVYQELSKLIAGGYAVRFAFSSLNRVDRISPHFLDVWRARRRLILSEAVSNESVAYFNLRMPTRVRELAETLSAESGLSPAEVLDHRHFRQAFAFARLAEAYGSRYLHSYFFYEGALFAYVASRLLDIPRGLSAYADHMLDDYELKVVALHLRSCSLVVATSQRIKRELTAIEPSLPGSRIVVKPNGIDLARFPATDRSFVPPTEEIGIVSVSRIEPKKGLIYLIEALGLLRQQGVALRAHLVGGVDDKDTDRRYHRALGEAIGGHGLGEAVHLVGKLTEGEIGELFRQSQIFVAPYIETDDGDKDGIPTALLEAMSSGLAIVATDAGSIAEVITHQQDGVIVNQRDAVQLAAAIAALAGNLEERSRLGRNAAQRVRSDFDAAATEAAFHDRLADLLAPRSR